MASFGDLDIQWLSAFDTRELLLSVARTAQLRVLRFDLTSNRSSLFLMGSAAQY